MPPPPHTHTTQVHIPFNIRNAAQTNKAVRTNGAQARGWNAAGLLDEHAPSDADLAAAHEAGFGKSLAR